MNTSCPSHDVICAVRSRKSSGIVAHDAVQDLLQPEPSDEDRTLIMRPRVTHNPWTQPTPCAYFAGPMKIKPSRCVHASPRWASIEFHCGRQISQMNSGWSNIKLRRQMISEFDEFVIFAKLMKWGIQWNWNQVIQNYNQRDILFWKLAKIHAEIG